jgi:hypothetical protein
MASATEQFKAQNSTRTSRPSLEASFKVSQHPEAPEDGVDVIPSHVSESSFIVEGQLYDAQIRGQQLQQKKHSLRGNIAKTDRKRMWADTEEVKRDIQKDDLDATQQRKVLNREGHIQSLAAKSYTVESTRKVNDGRRQKLLNEGVTLKLDHTGDFNSVIGVAK